MATSRKASTDADATETKTTPAAKTTTHRRDPAEAETTPTLKITRPKAVDTGDASIGWTVQSGHNIPDDNTGEIGAVYTPDQLPDPAVQAEVNVTPGLFYQNGHVYVDHGDGVPRIVGS